MSILRPASLVASRRAPTTALLCAAAFLGLLAPVARAAETVEERLAQLEKKVGALAEENASLRKQLGYDTKGKPGAALVTTQGKETKLAIGGFFHLNAEFGDAADARFPANDRFLLRKARLGIKGTLTEVVDFTLQADFGANSLGSTSGYRVQATDIFVLWKPHAAAQLTLGQFKTPFGYEQLLPETKTLAVERALSSDSLTIGRQAGAMLAGTLVPGRLTYAASLTNGLSANNSGNDNDQFAYAGRLAGTVLTTGPVTLSVGVNAFSTRDTGTFTGRRLGRGVDAQLALGRAELTAELLQARFNRDTGADYDARGWSVMGTYFVVPKCLQVLARYETYDPSDLVATDRTILRTLGFNYLIKGNDLKLSLNYLIGNPPGAASHRDRLLARLQLIY